MKLKLNLLFIVMDLLTILVYPIIFVHGKLHQFSKLKKNIVLNKLPVTVTDDQSKNMNVRKKGEKYVYSKDSFSRSAGTLRFS